MAVQDIKVIPRIERVLHVLILVYDLRYYTYLASKGNLSLQIVKNKQTIKK